MYGPSSHPATPRAGKQQHESVLVFDIVGAGEQKASPRDDSRALLAFDALSQSAIDDHLQTSSEFTAAQFDATSMGADAQGLIIDFGGEVGELIKVVASCYSDTAGSTKVERALKPVATLSDSTLASEAALGAHGNVAIKLNWGDTPDFDALTSGLVEVRIHWRGK